MEFYFDDAFLTELQELRDLSAHSETDLTELIKTAVREKLARLRTKRFGASSRSAYKSTFPGKLQEPGRQPIPATIRKQVHERDKGQCQFENVETHQTCASQFALELDHTCLSKREAKTPPKTCDYSAAHIIALAMDKNGGAFLARFLPEQSIQLIEQELQL